MFKHILPLFCCFFVSSLTAQQLQNTTWKTITPGGTDTNTVIATIDTLYLNGPTGSNLVTALFEEQGNVMLIKDLSGPVSCASPDTGHYSFSISNDTLVFNLIYDSCASRVFALDGAVLWRNSNPTAIDNPSSKTNSFSVFPNPSSGQINVITSEDGELEIRNLQGKIVFQKSTKAGKSVIDSKLPEGNFILIFRSRSQLAQKMIFIRD